MSPIWKIIHKCYSVFWKCQFALHICNLMTSKHLLLCKRRQTLRNLAALPSSLNLPERGSSVYREFIFKWMKWCGYVLDFCLWKIKPVLWWFSIEPSCKRPLKLNKHWKYSSPGSNWWDYTFLKAKTDYHSELRMWHEFWIKIYLKLIQNYHLFIQLWKDFSAFIRKPTVFTMTVICLWPRQYYNPMIHSRRASFPHLSLCWLSKPWADIRDDLESERKELLTFCSVSAAFLLRVADLSWETKTQWDRWLADGVGIKHARI